MKRAIRLGWFAVGLLIGGWLFAAERKSAPTLHDLDSVQAAAREACEAKGHTLRALLIAYDEKAQPVAVRAGCGEPRRSKS